MNAQPGSVRAFIDASADAVAREIATLRREAERERALWDAELRARMADMDARIKSLADAERKLDELATNVNDGRDGIDGRDGVDGKDGADADPEMIRSMVVEAVSQIPAPKDGRDGIDGKDGRDGKDADPDTIREMVAAAVAEIPAPKDGRDGVDGQDGRDGDSVHPDEVRAMVAELVAEIPAPQDGKDGRDGTDGKDGAPGERGPEGPAGKLPVAVVWSDRVHYEGEVATHQGATWQATRDTGHEPPHADWICLAARGDDGADGRSFLPRGLFDPQQEYRALDVVTLNASSFVANRDNPGECPGEGWFLLAGQGKRGKPGERGDIGQRGLSGAPGEAVVSLTVNDEGVMTLVNGDGSLIQCDLYPVLAKIR